MMKKLFYCLLLFAAVGCRAQQVKPLNTSYSNVQNGDYVKDFDNELDKYIGVYSAGFDNKLVTIHISKIEYKLIKLYSKEYYKDILEIKFIISDGFGLILQDTQNQCNNLHKIQSINFLPKTQSLAFSYSGTNCRIGNGLIYIKILNTNQISWTYNPQTTVIDDVSCPPSLDKKVYLPATENLIFTKQ